MTATPATAQGTGALAIEYISGQDVTVGSCKGWMNKRTTDGYVQALGQSWYSTDCDVWLERKRYNSDGSVAYNWKRVSNRYPILNSSASTGFHWNGTNAGSRVCVENFNNGSKSCSKGYW
jgi:hypothetical protein